MNYRGGPRSATAKGRSRALRRNPTEAEHRLWWRLRAGQVAGAKFRRQHQYGPYILDFFCVELRLAVEVDGGQHLEERQAAWDAGRTAYLQGEGIEVLRFTNVEVLAETDSVVEAIWQKATGPGPSP